MNILWNSDEQRINKGTFYSIPANNRLYNFLINDQQLIIDERTPSERGTDEKIIKFTLDSSTYHYSSLRHNETGSTYQTKYYSKNGTEYMSLALSPEEAANELNPLFERLELIDNIESILPIDTLKTEILGHINNQASSNTKKSI